MIVIIDYGMGNLRSVEKAVELVGGEVRVSDDPGVIAQADKIILPGVGAFPDGMSNLRAKGLLPVLEREVRVNKKPFLGICLGMQLLAKKSYEFGVSEGLGWIDAEIVRFDFSHDPTLRVPHVGWNDITVKREHPLLGKVKTGATFYFVHSYYMKNADPKDILASCIYGHEFTAIIQKENMFAAQFHPEKSQENGLNVLGEFVHWDYVQV